MLLGGRHDEDALAYRRAQVVAHERQIHATTCNDGLHRDWPRPALCPMSRALDAGMLLGRPRLDANRINMPSVVTGIGLTMELACIAWLP